LNARTVVEGVETVGEWQWAREHGADFAQGYLFAAPAEKPPRPRVPEWAADSFESPQLEPACVAVEAAQPSHS
jgi:EAL domain-containing protein (putative c-di-GMP-specific phosphodiesterase class I)